MFFFFVLILMARLIIPCRSSSSLASRFNLLGLLPRAPPVIILFCFDCYYSFDFICKLDKILYILVFGSIVNKLNEMIGFFFFMYTKDCGFVTRILCIC